MPKKVEKKEKIDDIQAFVGQNEAKQAAYETFKFAADHDPKDDYLSKADYIQHKEHIVIKEDAPTPTPAPVSAAKKEEAKKLDQQQISQEKK